jgi:hypothetical protein
MAEDPLVALAARLPSGATRGVQLATVGRAPAVSSAT